MTTLSTDIIEKALALNGKTMEDMEEVVQEWPCECDRDTHYINWIFSYSKFFAYLLSPEFIEKYAEILWLGEATIFSTQWFKNIVASGAWNAIYKFQSWNPKYLEDLLSKIESMTLSPLIRELYDRFAKKDLSEWCIVYNERYAKILSIDYDRAWYYKVKDDWDNIASWNISTAIILWHPPTLADLFRVATEKWWFIQISLECTRIKKWIEWEEFEVILIPTLPILEQQSEETIKQLVSIF